MEKKENEMTKRAGKETDIEEIKTYLFQRQYQYLFLRFLTFCSPKHRNKEIHTGSGKFLEPASSCERLPQSQILWGWGHQAFPLYPFRVGDVLHSILWEGLPAWTPSPDGLCVSLLFHCLSQIHSPFLTVRFFLDLGALLALYAKRKWWWMKKWW